MQEQNKVNNNSTVSMNQPRQYSFEEPSNNGDSLFHMSSKTISTNNGLRQEPSPPPPNGTTVPEGNYNTHFYTNI